MCLAVLLIAFVVFLSCFIALFEQIKCMYVCVTTDGTYQVLLINKDCDYDYEFILSNSYAE